MAIDRTDTTALAAVPHFARLPTEVLEELARRTNLRTFFTNAPLCMEGDTGDALFVLETGQVRAVRLMPSGREVVLATIDAPAAFGELSLIDGAPRSATILANRRSSVRIVTGPVYRELLDRHPAARDGLVRTLVTMVRQGNERHADALGLDATARTARWLLARPAAPRHDGHRTFPLGRTQGALAAELGITRVRLNQVLKSFETAGLVAVAGQRVTIRDEPALLSLCR